MRIKLSALAYVYTDNRDMKDFLKQNIGIWLTVETEHLFDNQYNTAEGYRIYDSMIDEIEGEVRHEKMKCTYCGKIVEQQPMCPKCSNELKRFNANNTAFIAWDGVKPKMPKIEEQKFGTYRLWEVNEHFRLQNGRQSFDFTYHNGIFWTTSGIGYGKKLSLPIPDKASKQLKEFLKKLLVNV